MNVVFRVAGGDEAIEKQFAKDATAANLIGTPGHRSVGGMRISLYNAVGLDAVEALDGVHARIPAHPRVNWAHSLLRCAR